MSDPITRLLIIFGAANALLLYIAVSLFVSLKRGVNKYNKLAQSQQVLRSRNKSRKIINEARDTAQRIINESKLYRHEIEVSVEDTIQEAVRTGLNSSLASASQDIREGAVSGLSLLSAKIDEEIAKSKTAVDKEILEYKEQKKREIDQKVVEVTKKILRGTLSESLDENDQEKLVLNALAKAKNNEIL